MSWLPRLSLTGLCSCEADDATFEGWCLQLRWRGFLFEIVFARQEADDAR